MENILLQALKTSSIDFNIDSDEKYQYELIANGEEKIVTRLRKYFEDCDEFIISVAFITMGGISLFLEELKNLENKGIKGKILTGDYLTFTEPKALKKLLSYKNIDLKVATNRKHHTKAYFFRKGNIWTLIVGSSNLTQGALTVNFEWNIKVNSLENGKIVKSVLETFNKEFDNLKTLTEEDIENYQKRYEQLKKITEVNNQNIDLDKIEPNSMQVQALKNLEETRKEFDRALLISATGTGKTYLSAFDVKQAKAKKILFVAHRKVILERSKISYQKILKDKKMEIFDNNYYQISDKDEVVFAMVQTLNKEKNLNIFPKDYFDYIIIDEVHHGGAKTYQSIFEYFKPKFLLGITATPERTDDFNIYQLFNYNVAYEIRLQDAMKEELLCPFHYFGISDISIDGETIDEKTSIKKLTSDERVKHILEKSKYYSYSGDKLHCLIFVSKVEEAKILVEKFLEQGVKAIALSSENSDNEREEAIRKLEQGEIEYIISVDIFNEGVDIPCVNQVILLRPTTSAIVYIQQLGRGLRKHKNKDYTVVLDFIGNYEKNFLIPIAISQNNSYDKDFMKRFLMNATDFLAGESSISFDEISKERIFENINKTNFSNRKLIEEDFKLLEKQLGKVPYLYDFYKRNMISPTVILKYKKDYDEVLKNIAPKYRMGTLNNEEKKFLIFLSTFFTPAKRIYEMLILKEILIKQKLNIDETINIMKNKYSLSNQENREKEDSIKNAFEHLSKEIFKTLSTTKSFEPILYKKDEEYYLDEKFKTSYEKNSYFKILIDDLIKYNLAFAEKNYNDFTNESIKLFGEYTKQEAFWYLNLNFNNGFQVSGYTPFENERKLLIFITMDNLSERADYSNEFYDSQTFSWFSKSSRYLKKDNKITIEGKIAENYYEINVFVKKNNGENFYYLGTVEKVLSAKEIKDSQGKSMVKYIFKLKRDVKKELLDYFNM
ncbi:DUF3427 domain-containing protein [Fusobacterium simiae]|uniref:DUF3427 domain-containing protein n=1 Tax=Fusobacterium simiae TaxID=855 RepID=A0ABT4DHU3_FUSSI|nr:DUF3427 domain-containing protein [Fusobacterium simiae]MCY7008174.1 DUF3427 domain-containing protein [Fusobacterium simiae]